MLYPRRAAPRRTYGASRGPATPRHGRNARLPQHGSGVRPTREYEKAATLAPGGWPVAALQLPAVLEGRNREADIPGLHFHELRHTGNTWAAESGATLRDPTNRMGHSTTRAALIYMHKTAGRDRKIANALGALVTEAQNGAANPQGAQGARQRNRDQK